MRYDEAVKRARAIGCPEALAAALKSASTKVPAPDCEAAVICREKVRRNMASDECDEECPE